MMQRKFKNNYQNRGIAQKKEAIEVAKAQIEECEEIYPLLQVTLIENKEFEMIDAQFYDRCMIKFAEAFDHNRQTQAIRTLGLLTKLSFLVWNKHPIKPAVNLYQKIILMELGDNSIKWINQTLSFLNDSEQRCVICFYKLADENKCNKLRGCEHRFYHQGCIDQWLRHDARCPTCRKYAR